MGRLPSGGRHEFTGVTNKIGEGGAPRRAVTKGPSSIPLHVRHKNIQLWEKEDSLQAARRNAPSEREGDDPRRRSLEGGSKRGSFY